MKNTFVILSIAGLMLCSSCSIFQKAKYPHLNKVPVNVELQNNTENSDFIKDSAICVVESQTSKTEMHCGLCCSEEINSDTISQTAVQKDVVKHRAYINPSFSLNINFNSRSRAFSPEIKSSDPASTVWMILGAVGSLIVLTILISFVFDMGFIVTGILVFMVPLLVIMGLYFSWRNAGASDRKEKKSKNEEKKPNNSSVFVENLDETPNNKTGTTKTKQSKGSNAAWIIAAAGTFLFVLGLWAGSAILLILGGAVLLAILIGAGIFFYNSLMKK